MVAWLLLEPGVLPAGAALCACCQVRSDEAFLQELNEAMDKMNALGAWEMEGKAKDVLALLGLSDPNMKIEAMSGGQVCSSTTCSCTASNTNSCAAVCLRLSEPCVCGCLQARKVAVASALLGTPEVLILDEPTNHMDVQVRLIANAVP